MSQFVAYVKSTANSIGQSLNKAGAELQLATSAAVSRTSVELQNPVVIAQIAVAAGAAAGYQPTWKDIELTPTTSTLLVYMPPSLLG